MSRSLGIEATQKLAECYRSAYFDGIEGVESEDGMGRGHLAWMLDRITHDDMPIDKASRWLGYVQAHLVAFAGVTLENLRKQVRSVVAA